MATPSELPYVAYEQTALWTAIEAALADLEQNQDLQLLTAKRYVIGLLCQQLASKHLVTSQSIAR
jgi:hypothetical protein